MNVCRRSNESSESKRPSASGRERDAAAFGRRLCNVPLRLAQLSPRDPPPPLRGGDKVWGHRWFRRRGETTFASTDRLPPPRSGGGVSARFTRDDGGGKRRSGALLRRRGVEGNRTRIVRRDRKNFVADSGWCQALFGDDEFVGEHTKVDVAIGQDRDGATRSDHDDFHTERKPAG